MEPVTGLLAKRAAEWWFANRPFSKEKRTIRKQRRRLRKENREREELGLEPHVLPEEPLMNTGLRTSTVGTGAFILVYVVMQVITHFAPDFVAAVPALEETVAAIAAYVAARLNKTPKEPGIV